MVIVKEYDSPLIKWHLSRIVETIKGADDKVRVVPKLMMVNTKWLLQKYVNYQYIEPAYGGEI
ncbi:hypothetical protein FF38_13590 [Lucilia cuprina]|uniref:DUF5641 domain-containing protein n=1 Tax=Lucilia cuprina TaxID=7375 RepID=A0A0L0BR02_LUCCU|nr:hypothetical protein CVS40_6381 [Lucilia cuprina]KNC22462.1 hypothetical protein FF38_13590 [Lucilia cuprina]